MPHSTVDTNDISKDLFGYGELCQYLGISIHTARQWVSQGRVPHIKLGGGSLVRFKRQDIIKWIESSRVEAMQ